MRLGPSSPAVSFNTRTRSTSVLTNASLHSISHPLVVGAELGVQFCKVLLCQVRICQTCVQNIVLTLSKVGAELGLASVAKCTYRECAGDVAETVQISADGVQERRRVGVFRVLNLELLWNTAPSFLSKNLLSLNPTIVVLAIIPTLDNLQTIVDEENSEGVKVSERVIVVRLLQWRLES